MRQLAGLKKKQRIDVFNAILKGQVERGEIAMRFDQNDLTAFARQLEYIYAETYNIEYPAFECRALFPSDNRIPDWAETWSYKQFNRVGSARILNDYADDAPAVDLTGKEFSGKVAPIRQKFTYSIQELRTGAATGISLDKERATAARDAMEQKLDELCCFGDANYSIVGVLDATGTGIPITSLAAAGTWIGGKTPIQIIADMSAAANAPSEATLGLRKPDTMLVPLTRYNYIASTAMGAQNDTTILAFFLKNNPYIKRVMPWSRLETAGASSSKRLFVFSSDPKAIALQIPQEFEMFQPQPKNLSWQVDCHMRTAGVKVPYPLAHTFMDGI
jgi:hypothetical protein